MSVGNINHGKQVLCYDSESPTREALRVLGNGGVEGGECAPKSIRCTLASARCCDPGCGDVDREFDTPTDSRSSIKGSCSNKSRSWSTSVNREVATVVLGLERGSRGNAGVELRGYDDVEEEPVSISCDWVNIAGRKNRTPRLLCE